MDIQEQRMTAPNDEDVVVFLIGMRINKPWKVHKWLPVGRAMGRMLDELYANPDLGLLHHESWPGRTVILVQYWQSLEKLMDYARNRDAVHLPAWAEFNRKVGSGGDVGIWHETYSVAARSYETVYNNMPAFGLSKALGMVPANDARFTAAGRMGRTAGEDAPVDEQGRMAS